MITRDRCPRCQKKPYDCRCPRPQGAPVTPAFPQPPMFFQCQDGKTINLWAVCRVAARTLYGVPDGSLGLWFGEGEPTVLTGPDATAVAEILDRFSVRARVPDAPVA